jgi:hypothetical protein
VRGIYLSELVCKQLKIIPENFPDIGAANNPKPAAAAATSVESCGLPEAPPSAAAAAN